jgi:predicted ester cyclase
MAGDLEALKQQTLARIAGFPDGRTTIEDLIAEEDRVTKRWAYQGTHTHEWNGIPPTGKRVTVTGITIYRLEGGKIAECWWGYDVLGLLQQLEVAPLPAQQL